MQSHKWLCRHEKPSTEPVGSAASVATRGTNAEELELSQDQLKPKKSLPLAGVITTCRDITRKVEAELRKRVKRAREQPKESARTKPQREDWAQRPQPEQLPA